LEKSLREDGRVNFIQASLDSVEDAFKRVDDSDISIVVNCSGFGFKDPAVFPTRGTSLDVLCN
jgi:hypothetical protein